VDQVEQHIVRVRTIWTTLNVAIVTAAAGNLTAAFLIAKAIAAACALSATWALARVARAPKKGEETGGVRSDSGFVVLAFAFNPLVVSTVGVGAHPDIAVAAAAGAVLSGEETVIGQTRSWSPWLHWEGVCGGRLVAWLLCLTRAGGAGRRLHMQSPRRPRRVRAAAPFWGGLSRSGLAINGEIASASCRDRGGASRRATDGCARRRLLSDELGRAGNGGRSPVPVAVGGALGLYRTMWRAAALLFGAYLLFTPRYLPPWTSPGCRAGRRRFRRSRDVSTVVFSASSLVVGGGLVRRRSSVRAASCHW
jgi:hypothetical protein